MYHFSKNIYTSELFYLVQWLIPIYKYAYTLYSAFFDMVWRVVCLSDPENYTNGNLWFLLDTQTRLVDW